MLACLYVILLWCCLACACARLFNLLIFVYSCNNDFLSQFFCLVLKFSDIVDFPIFARPLFLVSLPCQSTVHCHCFHFPCRAVCWRVSLCPFDFEFILACTVFHFRCLWVRRFQVSGAVRRLRFQCLFMEVFSFPSVSFPLTSLWCLPYCLFGCCCLQWPSSLSVEHPFSSFVEHFNIFFKSEDVHLEQISCTPTSCMFVTNQLQCGVSPCHVLSQWTWMRRFSFSRFSSFHSSLSFQVCRCSCASFFSVPHFFSFRFVSFDFHSFSFSDVRFQFSRRCSSSCSSSVDSIFSSGPGGGAFSGGAVRGQTRDPRLASSTRQFISSQSFGPLRACPAVVIMWIVSSTFLFLLLGRCRRQVVHSVVLVCELHFFFQFSRSSSFRLSSSSSFSCFRSLWSHFQNTLLRLLREWWRYLGLHTVVFNFQDFRCAVHYFTIFMSFNFLISSSCFSFQIFLSIFRSCSPSVFRGLGFRFVMLLVFSCLQGIHCISCIHLSRASSAHIDVMFPHIVLLFNAHPYCCCT